MRRCHARRNHARYSAGVRVLALGGLMALALATLCCRALAQPATQPGGGASGGSGAGLAIGSAILGPTRSMAITRQAAESLQLNAQYLHDVDAILTQYESQARDLAAQSPTIAPANLATQIQNLIRQERARVAAAVPLDQRMPFFHKLAELVVQQWVGPDGAVQKVVLADNTLTAAERLDIKRIDTTTDANIKKILADADIQSRLPDLVAELQDYRVQIMAVLTPAQQAGARNRLAQATGTPAPAAPANAAGARTGATGRSTASTTAPAGRAGNSSMMMDGTAGSSGAAKPASIVGTGLEPLPASAAVGQSVPDLRLLRFDGTPVYLANFCRDHVTLFEFGSYSSPEFRQRVEPMKKLVATYGTRIQFFIVYTREAHPIGDQQTSQNKTDGILVEQPADAAARHRLAAEARQALTITSPMLMDGMDNALEKSLGGFPNAAVIVGRDGKIAARQQWADPSGLKGLLDDALAAKAPTTRAVNP